MTRARWPGQCVLCGQPINPGDPIAQRSDGWAHTRCALAGMDGQAREVDA